MPAQLGTSAGDERRVDTFGATPRFERGARRTDRPQHPGCGAGAGTGHRADPHQFHAPRVDAAGNAGTDAREFRHPAGQLEHGSTRAQHVDIRVVEHGHRRRDRHVHRLVHGANRHAGRLRHPCVHVLLDGRARTGGRVRLDPAAQPRTRRVERPVSRALRHQGLRVHGVFILDVGPDYVVRRRTNRVCHDRRTVAQHGSAARAGIARSRRWTGGHRDTSHPAPVDAGVAVRRHLHVHGGRADIRPARHHRADRQRARVEHARIPAIGARQWYAQLWPIGRVRCRVARSGRRTDVGLPSGNPHGGAIPRRHG